MIIFEFTHSNDQSILGQQEYFFHKLKIGRASTNDIIIMDGGDEGEELADSHLEVYEKNGQLFLNALSAPTLLNSKKFLGHRALKINDEIKVAQTSFKLLSFRPTEAPKQDFPHRYSSAINNDPELQSICESLERELIIIERDVNESST